MNPISLNQVEKKAIVSLSIILALRMIGLFMVLPVFTLYARELTDATPFLVGLAFGIYGLAQAFFQIPFGYLSDKFGRKPIIFIGLLIFCLGSFIAGASSSIYSMIIGRTLQGVGAIGSTILALLADLTRDEHRSIAMAVSGISIGISFSLAMILGPYLLKWLSVNDLFYLASVFGFLGLIILYVVTPKAKVTYWPRNTQTELKTFKQLFFSSQLAKLNIGIFLLHTIFTASFIAIPLSLKVFNGLDLHQQSSIYLPSLLLAFLVSLVAIRYFEKKQRLKFIFVNSILLLALSEFLFLNIPQNLHFIGIALFVFFTGFSILEAFMPSLITRSAPSSQKGSALGIYSCSQFLGIFVGGTLGGYLYGKFSFFGIYSFCLFASFVWFIIALFMESPKFYVTETWKILPNQIKLWETLSKELHSIPGIVEVTFIEGESVAYLKMEKNTTKLPKFIQLKERLGESLWQEVSTK